MADARKQIVVGCKLPQGLIAEVGYEMVPGGMRKLPTYKRIKFNGAEQHALITGVNRTPNPSQLKPGLTAGIDEEFFTEWASRAGKNLVASGVVFRADNAKDAQAIQTEMTKEKIGFEAVNPGDHPGIGKRTEDDAKVA